MKRRWYKLIGQDIVETDDFADWISWAETADMQVDLTENADFRVSTIFLDTNHDWRGERPILFETMVFVKESYEDRIPKDESLDRHQRRYSTWEDALAGHAAVVALLERQMEDAVAKTLAEARRPK